MATQYTVTFFSGGWDKHSFPPPVFKKVFTDTNVPFSEIVNRELTRKCDFIEIELRPKIQHLGYVILKGQNDFKDGIKSIWYCFNSHPLVIEMMFSVDLERQMPSHIEDELWDRDVKIMKIFKSNEIAIVEDKTGEPIETKEVVEKNTSNLEVSFFIDNESSSIVAKIYQSKQNDLSGLTMEEVIKSVKSMSAIIKELIKSIKNKHCQKPTPSKLTFATHKSQS